MNTFTKIDDATALVCTASGIYNESEVFHLGSDLFVPSGKGYARITSKGVVEGTYHTSDTKLRVIRISGKDILPTKFGVSYVEPRTKKNAAKDRT